MYIPFQGALPIRFGLEFLRPAGWSFLARRSASPVSATLKVPGDVKDALAINYPNPGRIQKVEPPTLTTLWFRNPGQHLTLAINI